MKTEFREHPLGTPGLTVRLRGEEPTGRPARKPRLAQRALEWIGRALAYRGNGPQ